MKVQEFINRVEDQKFIEEYFEKIKKYIPAMDKKKLVMQVLSACTYETDGFIEVDRFKMDIYFDMCVLNVYADFDISFDFDEMINEYDALCESELMFWIKDWFMIDYEATKKVLDNELKTLLEQNSLDAQIVRLVSGVKKLIDTFEDKLDGIDLSTLLPDGIDAGQFEQVMKMIK